MGFLSKFFLKKEEISNITAKVRLTTKDNNNPCTWNYKSDFEI